MKFSFFIIALFVTCLFSHAQSTDMTIHSVLDMPIPLDTALHIGVLPNGLTYYVRHNENPAKNAEFYLVQKTGSLIEEDDELGMAHFLEHLLFNNTKHFPNKSIVKYLERNGIAFGPDVNAFTAFDNTIYTLRGVPTTFEHVIDSCLLILRDWSCDAFIDPSDMDRERSVVIEEWRMRSGTTADRDYTHSVFEGSVLDRRLPIGDTTIVRSCTLQHMEQFYRKWYQPQLQAVVAVGDFDACLVVEKIKNLFSDIPHGNTTLPEIDIFPHRSGPSVHISTSPQQQIPVINITSDVVSPKDMDKVRFIINMGAFKMFESSLTFNLNRAYKQEKVSVGLNVSQHYNFCYNPQYNIQLFPLYSQWKQALECCIRELYRFQRYASPDRELLMFKPYVSKFSNGFSDSLLVSINEPLDIPDRLNNTVANDCAQSFISGISVLSPSVADKLTDWANNFISSEIILQAIAPYDFENNFSVNIIAPEEDDTPTPTDTEVLDIIHKVKAEDIKAKTFSWQADTAYLAVVPAPSSVVDSLPTPTGCTYYFANGIELNFINSDADMARVYGTRPGGFSFFEDDELAMAYMYKSCAKANPFAMHTNEVEDDFNAFYFSSGNFEDSFKQIYYAWTTPVVDTLMYMRIKDEYRRQLRKESKAIIRDRQLSERGNMLSYSRDKYMTKALYDSLSIERLLSVQGRHLSNFNGAKLYAEGNMNNECLMSCIKKYIGGLPSKPELRHFIDRPADHYMTHDSTLVEYYVTDVEPHASVHLFVSQENNYEINPHNTTCHRALTSVMDQIFTEKVRFDKGALYDISIVDSEQRIPAVRHCYKIEFSCAIERREEIVSTIRNTLHEMAYGNLITPDMLNTFVMRHEKNPTFDKLEAQSLTVEDLRQFLRFTLDNGCINEASVIFSRE